MAWQSKIDRSAIHPGLVAVMDMALLKLHDIGMPFKVYSGLRAFDEQDKLYAKGRDANNKVVDKSKVVTNARGGQSMHNYGLAIDAAPLVDPKDPDGNVHWPDPDSLDNKPWFALEDTLLAASQEIDEGEVWDGIDFEWGGRWKFRDVPHIQVRTTLGELQGGLYPYCRSVDWLVKAHTTFLYDTPWMNRRIQYLLNMQSYPCGVVDGDLGPRSEAAVALFTGDQGLPDEVSRTTVERLVRLDYKAVSQRP